ncbi:orotidine-5'-phosphate decarboxylase [Moorena sp. SIO4A5]|uniref:orotidine-5'-phosphate decarboxylase n=1 Tax=Moorena sp. SIO4A5 TaxID=2607838 RepID=UPI0025EBE4E4|nr:orotidine-5'-phosphate decarboxylase [Moorena sp. SIO4A5]
MALPVDVWRVRQEMLPSPPPLRTGLETFTLIRLKPIQSTLLCRCLFLALFKFHDIPNTVAGATRVAAAYGVDLITIHAVAGRNALKRAAEAAVEGALTAGCPPPKLIGITLLTSLNSRDLAFDLKIPIELPEFVLQMALLAQESGLNGAVCSPMEVSQLRQVCGDDFLLVCPGVRPQWSEQGDQRRAMTPVAALQAGADYLVIGRPITAADDPVAAWNRICEELAGTSV